MDLLDKAVWQNSQLSVTPMNKDVHIWLKVKQFCNFSIREMKSYMDVRGVMVH